MSILRLFEFELSEVAVIKLHLKFLTIRKQRRRSRTHTRFRERRMRKRATKSFPVRCFPLPRLSIGHRGWGEVGEVDYSPRETTRTANKGPRARYIMSSRTHKKTRLRNSNDIMFAPLFSRRKGAAVDPGGREKGGCWKRKRESATATRTRKEGGRVGGIEGKTRRQPGRLQDEEGAESSNVTGG